MAEELQRQLDDSFADYVDPRRDALTKEITGCGQLGLSENSTCEDPMFANEHLNGADWDLWLANGNPAPEKP